MTDHPLGSEPPPEEQEKPITCANCGTEFIPREPGKFARCPNLQCRALLYKNPADKRPFPQEVLDQVWESQDPSPRDPPEPQENRAFSGDAEQTIGKPRLDLTAALLTLLLPGLGQLYRRKVVFGLAWLFATSAAYLWVIPLALVLHLACIYHAAKGAPPLSALR